MKADFKDLVIIFLVILSVALIPLIPAEFSIGDQNHSISKVYGPEMNIKGWINISFDEEPKDSDFVASFGENTNESKISLEELLEKSIYEYGCTPQDCETNYAVSNGQTTKTITMDSGDSRLVGFRLNGKIKSINSVEFEIQSNAGVSDESQLKIDLFDNGEVNIINNKTGTGISSKNYGCFDLSEDTDRSFILGPGGKFCQKINLTQSPGFELGAWIRGEVIGEYDELEMTLYNLNRNEQRPPCILEDVTSTSGEEYSCSINYPVIKPEEHFVCISISPGGGTGNYRIEGERENVCGFYGSFPGTENLAFRIFADGKKFDSFGTLKITDNLSNDSKKLSIKIWEYLVNRYGLTAGEIVCPSEGCIVPINLISTVNQDVTLKNLKLVYHDLGAPIEEIRFYNLESSPAGISSNYQRLSLDNAGFKVPSELGNHTFTLKLKGKEILSEEIEVKNVPIIESLTPRSTAAGFGTIFSVDVAVPKNESVVSYRWDFGDNNTLTTSINKAVYIYPEINNYTIEVSVTDTRGLSSSGDFEIKVLSPKDHINSTLDSMDSNLDSVKKVVQTQKSFQQRSLNSLLETTNLTSELESLKKQFDEAKNESDYMDMVESVINLNSKIPEKIGVTSRIDSFPFFPEKDFIEMGIVEAIGEGDYNPRRREDYQNAVIFWQMENIDLTVGFSEFSAEYESGTDILANFFEFKINEKRDINYDYYFIMPSRGTEFEGRTDEQGNYFYTNLKGVSTVNFYTTEDLDFRDVPIFVSPAINRLSLERGPLISSDDESKAIIFILIMVFLVIVSIISYIVLQQWYKKKYERYLFPNRNDLYNIVNYVNSAKKKGLEKSEIKNNLKKSNWNSEQINYVMRKYEGKRTGMIELPLPKFGKIDSEDNRPPRGHPPKR